MSVDLREHSISDPGREKCKRWGLTGRQQWTRWKKCSDAGAFGALFSLRIKHEGRILILLLKIKKIGIQYYFNKRIIKSQTTNLPSLNHDNIHNINNYKFKCTSNCVKAESRSAETRFHVNEKKNTGEILNLERRKRIPRPRAV